MSTPSPRQDVPVRRIDRILAFMSLGLLAVSILCFFTIMIASAFGMTQADFLNGLWPLVSVLPLLGLPIAFLLLLAVLIMSFVRRARANRGQ
ncbi:multidrug ABC transporter ATPase [Microbacterium sp. P01]|uniref:multidrug ABC transporter ATPase n=1 Tax=unclassified Microbacterium TaxID=2609290 RepID=UPI00366FBA03